MLCWSLPKVGHGLKVIPSANKQPSPAGAAVWRKSQLCGFANIVCHARFCKLLLGYANTAQDTNEQCDGTFARLSFFGDFFFKQHSWLYIPYLLIWPCTPSVEFSNVGTRLSPSLSPHSTDSFTSLRGRYSAYTECRGDKELSIILYFVCQSL